MTQVSFPFQRSAVSFVNKIEFLTICEWVLPTLCWRNRSWQVLSICLPIQKNVSQLDSLRVGSATSLLLQPELTILKHTLSSSLSKWAEIGQDSTRATPPGLAALIRPQRSWRPGSMKRCTFKASGSSWPVKNIGPLTDPSDGHINLEIPINTVQLADGNRWGCIALECPAWHLR